MFLTSHPAGYSHIYRLKERSVRADEAEAKYDALNARIEEIQAKYDVRPPSVFVLYFSTDK